MGEFRFRRYVMKAAKAEGICVHADSIDAAIPKAIDLVYKDQRPVTVLIADNLEKKVEQLEATLERVRPLPDKWNNSNHWCCNCPNDISEIVNELKAAIKGESDE